jgi:hypothetical protein
MCTFGNIFTFGNMCSLVICVLLVICILLFIVFLYCFFYVCLFLFVTGVRNCLLQRVPEGKIQRRIEVTGRRERGRRTLLDDLKERIGYSHLKEEALDRTMWRARFGRGFGPVVGQTNK